MTRTRQAGVIVATICGLALMGCGDESPASDAREAAAQSSDSAGSERTGTADKDAAEEGTADRKDGANRGRRSEGAETKSPTGDSDDATGDAKSGSSSAEEDHSSHEGSDAESAESESTPNDQPAEDSGSDAESDSPAPSAEPAPESAPDDSHPGPAWTPAALITSDLAPTDGYAVANDEDTLDRPSIADPCRSENLASEAEREERRLLWWSPDGKEGSSPVIAVDGIGYPDGGAADALAEIRDRVESCSEQSYGEGSTLKLSMGDADGLMSDSVVVEMELSGNYSGTGRAIYQHVDDMVVTTFAMYELADSDEANQLVTELAQGYAERIRAGS